MLITKLATDRKNFIWTQRRFSLLLLLEMLPQHRFLEDAGLIQDSATSTADLVYRSLPIFGLTTLAFLYVILRNYWCKVQVDNRDGNTVAEDVDELEDKEEEDENDIEMTEGSATTL